VKFILIDNYDSFTFMLADYIKQLGVVCDVFRNDDVNLVTDLINDYDALVFSPGPGSPENAGKMPDIIKEFWSIKPMLGVCLGHQAIAQYAGANIVKANIPMHGKVQTISHFNHPMFTNVPQSFKVTRYHSLIVNLKSNEFAVTAVSPTQEIMAIAHQTFPIWGVQFHPESCETTYGSQIILNFVQNLFK
jgi:anthranilate synthase/aminodeoxychorismate synthase-like glutamine amidotransferase